MAAVNMVHVPYRGLAPALTDLFGRQVQVIFSTMPPSIENVRANKLRALAVTSAIGSEALPGLPTIGDFLPGYEATMFTGIGAPKNIPDRNRREAEQGNQRSSRRPRDEGPTCRPRATSMPGTPADFGKLIADETEKWGKVIRAANIKPE